MMPFISVFLTVAVEYKNFRNVQKRIPSLFSAAMLRQAAEVCAMCGVPGWLCECVRVGVTASRNDEKANDEAGDAGFSASLHQALGASKTFQSATLEHLSRVYLMCV